VPLVDCGADRGCLRLIPGVREMLKLNPSAGGRALEPEVFDGEPSVRGTMVINRRP
jgi:hypothetical protein